jgi:hypothetical protein
MVLVWQCYGGVMVLVGQCYGGVMVLVGQCYGGVMVLDAQLSVRWWPLAWMPWAHGQLTH